MINHVMNLDQIESFFPRGHLEQVKHQTQFDYN